MAVAALLAAASLRLASLVSTLLADGPRGHRARAPPRRGCRLVATRSPASAAPQPCGRSARVLELEDHVVPGEIRHRSVVVGNYRGAPAQDCEYLIERLCDWLNGPDFAPRSDE